ncbi:LLM class flavin-dependent oxidoreductase [Gordonia amicalis]|uniref:LLM class flavin-dependent oxidoreductase n=1 Tax=Gordonia amicalis TaxID=89053 RepID=UPI0028701097|nr:LLM class flavin-dependent oxidoreductase [Gordonia amicalis]
MAARAVATLDVVSGGRVELGVGAGWSEAEWDLVGVDFARRGELLDETLDVLDGLWTQKSFAYQGAHHEFPSVGFEPKPVQQPRPPLHIGGESAPALRRAAARGGGWIGMHHTPASVAAPLARLRAAERDSGRSRPLQTTVAAHQGAVDAEGWSASGIDRVIVAPWSRSGEALDGLRRFAREHIRPRSE